MHNMLMHDVTCARYAAAKRTIKRPRITGFMATLERKPNAAGETDEQTNF